MMALVHIVLSTVVNRREARSLFTLLLYSVLYIAVAIAYNSGTVNRGSILSCKLNISIALTVPGHASFVVATFATQDLLE
jgi:hypothetical protein